jgi:TolB-like protein/tRNA A-37 threonylcarbamoyl transferase component Bud32
VTAPLDRLTSALGDRYALERQVGEGGMATVYLARDLKHERKVAIKVLRPELSVSLGADRFLREIRVAANLQHPNILALYDSGEVDGLLYYVMPFVEGESLRDRLNREQQLPLHDALQLTREAAEALAHAHQHGIVHRDIKPENILLLGGHALVADFGIARAVTSAGGEKLTQTGMAVGTPHYMSPEQALGSEHVDARSDVYSLGCVLYESLVGQPPFTGPNAMAIMARHSMEAVPSMQVVRSSIPDEVEDATMQALEKTPADRFQTMQEFAEVLSEVEADAAMQRTAARRAATATRRTGGTTKGVPARRTGARAVQEVHRKTPVELAAAAIREGGFKFWSVALTTLAVIVALSWTGWRALRGHGADAAAAATETHPERIAVLYFDSRGGSDSLGYVADGLTEALIHELSQVKPLEVISRNGVSPYRRTTVPPDSIGRALKVGTLVSGNVAQSADSLRVIVSLINAATGEEIASKTLERPRKEIFALQDDLAKEVSLFLRDRVGQEIKLRESRIGTSNTAAWELLQRAGQLSNDVEQLLASQDTAAAARHLSQADSLLARAEALDPEWVTPPIQRGWLAYHETDLVSGFDKTYYSTWIKRGLGHADRALKIKPNDPDGLELRGTLEYLRWLIGLEPDQDAAKQLLTQAEQDLRGAVAGNPTAAWAWTVLSHLLIGQSQTAEAKLAAQRAYEADPYLTSAKQTVWRLFQSSLDLEDKTEAAHWCQVGETRFPEYYRFTECQIWLFALKGQPPDVKKAWELYDAFVKVSPPSAKAFNQLYGGMLVAMALARAGLPDSARAVAERSRGDATVDPTKDLAYYEALVRMLLGDQDEAIRLLSTYVAANPQRRVSIGKDDTWWFREVRKDPRFKTLFGVS